MKKRRKRVTRMEAEQSLLLKMIISVISGGFLLLFVHLFKVLWLTPFRLRTRIHRQGIRGPSPTFLLGNISEMKRIQLHARLKAKAAPKQHHHQEQDGVALSHGWHLNIFPYIEQWRKKYGSIFLFSTGNIQILLVTDLEILKEMSLCRSLALGKPSYLSKDRGPLLGQGVISSNGQIWARQRKIVSPEFYLDKVKGLLSMMMDSTNSMLRSWECKIDYQQAEIADIKIDEDLRRLSGDVIARACFGSSYSQGKEIFLKLTTILEIMSKNSIFIGIPGLRYMPTKNNKEIWKLEKDIHSKILEVVQQRTQQARHEKDLLQMILQAAESDGDLDSKPSGFNRDKFIVDNCKNIYFAGYETTAITAAWGLILLAAHPDWQARARAEMQDICGDRLPDVDMLRNMKILTMVIQETLRLYPPAAFVTRETYEDLKLKEFLLPKGINTWVPIPFLHQDRDIWGPDAHQFNPERFSSGITGACKFPQAYIPFGMGSRICLGQHFGMIELKAILSLTLSKFSFSISPAYKHSPAFKLVMEPEHGVNLLVKKV